MPLRGIFAALALAPWTAMADRFDVVTFDAPPGWTRQTLGNDLMFEMRLMGTRSSCQIVLRTSRTPTASLPQELDRAWSELRQPQPLVAETPDPAQLELPSGFLLAQRVGQVQTSTGALLVMLNLLQQDDRIVPVVVNITDAQAAEVCGTAIGDFVAGLKLDVSAPAAGTPTGVQVANTADSQPTSDPQLAARFGNSVVGTWRFALTSANVSLNAPTQVRNVIEVRFAREGTYKITVNMSVPGSASFNDDESGTYQVQGQRVLMRPAQTTGRQPYALDWFFGDHPEFPGNWGLILRSSSEWLGSFSGSYARWRTFKPAE